MVSIEDEVKSLGKWMTNISVTDANQMLDDSENVFELDGTSEKNRNDELGKSNGQQW